MIADFDQELSDLVAKYMSGDHKLTPDEVMGTLELQLYAIQEAEELSVLDA
jgi:hypothetical protein